jgi:hypothetical protein
VRDGLTAAADLAVGGSPTRAFLAWRERSASGAETVVGAAIGADGTSGEVRRLSSEGSVGVAPLVASASGRWSAVGWVEQRGAARVGRVARLDGRSGRLHDWLRVRLAPDSVMGAGVADDGRVAVAWREMRGGRRLTRLASGSLARPRPSAQTTLGRPASLGGITRDLSLAPAVATARGGRSIVVATRPVSAFATTLEAFAWRPRETSAVTLSVGQLRINQRISQAAVRRVNALAARLDGRAAARAPGRGSVRFTLSVGQLRINQRISQAAVRRVNALATRLGLGSGDPAGPRRGAPGRVTLTAEQLRINQRISQAAIRRVEALEEAVARG